MNVESVRKDSRFCSKIGEGNEGLYCPKCNADKPEKMFSAFVQEAQRSLIR
jgi:hypothetical protein